MSEPKTPASDGEPEQVDSPTMEEPETSEDHTDWSEPPPAEPQRIAGKGLGLTALIIALCALGLSVWQWSQETLRDADDNDQPAIEDVASRLAGLEQSQSDQDQSLQQVLERTSDDSLNSLVDSRIDDILGDRLDDRLDNRLDNRLEPVIRQVDALAAELNDTTELGNDIQSTLSTLQSAVTSGERQREELSARVEQAVGVQREVDQELLLRLAVLEAAALLRFGQTQAELAGDYSSAAAAFRHAQSRLESNADPRLGQTRQRLSAELDALESSRGPDWAEAQLRLARLSDRVESWPLAASGDESSPPDAQIDSGSGWWAGMKNSLGQLVEVERRDPLELDAEQTSALREQIRLRLVAAELAIERRDMESARRHLQNVDERIEGHFEISNPDVIEARVTLDEIQSLQPADPPSDLGRALASLNQVLEAL